MSALSPSYREWLAKADSDFAVIELTINAPHPLWDAICFHAEQAAEKYLKALLAYHPGVLPNPDRQAGEAAVLAARRISAAIRNHLQLKL